MHNMPSFSYPTARSPPPVASPHLSEEKPPVTVARPAPTSSTQLPRGLQTPAQTPRPAQRPQILRPSILPLTKPTASKLAVQQPVAPTIKPAPPQNGVVGASPSSSMHVSDADTKGKLDIEFSTQFFASDDDALYAGVDLNAESYGDDTSTSLDAISMAPPPNPLPPLEPPVLIMDPRKDLGPGPAGGKSAANVSNTAASSTSTHLPVHNAMGGFQVSDQASRAARRISLLNANVFSTDEAATQREEQLVPGKKRSIDDMNSIVVPTNTGTLGGVRRPGKSPLPLLDSEPVVAKRQKT
ncbi:hypothetical protein BS47DRAFT_476817 [Hydnum rufescens UP504]|uniref:Uncharacterized protein n=1 Tax=Hydnum rufescens UP504 TaxID=1448309 RepID=A0A9P6B4T9_9AGAM|nr:hypothetical protein BS47DRAFT_476817 [Hydnum rufescens UP504]